MEKIIKNKKIMIALAAIIIVIATIIIVRRKRKSEETDSSGAGSSPQSSLPVASYPLQPNSVAGEYSAAKGSYGQQIAELQKICVSQGAKLTVDGYYGPKSEAVFQQNFGKTSFSKEDYDKIIEKN